MIFLEAPLSAQTGLQAEIPQVLPASIAGCPCFSPRCPPLQQDLLSPLLGPVGYPRRKALSVSIFWALFQAHARRKGAWGGGERGEGESRPGSARWLLQLQHIFQVKLKKKKKSAFFSCPFILFLTAASFLFSASSNTSPLPCAAASPARSPQR